MGAGFESKTARKTSKKKSKKSRKQEDGVDEPVVEDRFAAAETRPQFRSLPANQSKIVLDDRFASVLTDSRFQLEAKDKYGRRSKKDKKKSNKNGSSSGTKEELSAFYTIENSTKPTDDDNDNDKKMENDRDDEEEDGRSNNGRGIHKESSEEEDSGSEAAPEKEDPTSRIAYLTALSRGELDMSSSDQDSDGDDSDDGSSDEDDDEEDGEDPVYGTAGVLDPSHKMEQEEDIEISYDDSPYLVATNLDWENIRAVDIFSILSSFAPPGAVKKVQVYQSDFGMERMAQEKLQGPTGIWKKKKTPKSNVAELTPFSEDGEDEHSDESENEEALNKSVDGSISGDEGIDSELDQEEADITLGREDFGTMAPDESDFDPEKLRAYEASKLKYFFAVVQFSQTEHADIAYREVDGMEFEHSSSAIDLRTLPPEALDDVVKDRPLRDEATSVPSNYEPPDFIVSALQQTNVQCTWDQGDAERERRLTKYTTGGWNNMAETDDLKAYLASDASSDDDSEDEKNTKSSAIRKLLGLDSDGEDGGGGSDKEDNDSDSESSGHDSQSESEEEGGKTIKFIPGTKSLQEKIRNKLESKEETKELTPWQKYQEKRKQKRKERRQAARNKRSGRNDPEESEQSDSPPPSDNDEDSEQDDFFLDDETRLKREAKKDRKTTQDAKPSKTKSAKHELELLMAGEHAEEEARDYDIRGIQRMEKNKGKKLRGSRKRKEDKLSSDVSGKDFKVNVHDDRFAAVLDGADARFGIDKTDPRYRDTSAMKEILSEQTKRRKKKRRKKNSSSFVPPDVSVQDNGKSAGASALSALVQKLKTQVS